MINFQNIPWLNFQKQLQADAVLATGSVINVSDTWTPGTSIHIGSLEAAYSSLKAYSWDFLDRRHQYWKFPIAPTIPSLNIMLKNDHNSDQTSTGQEATALSSLSTGFELVQAVIYLSTNNLLAGQSMSQFLEWVADSSRRWVLKSIFSYKTPTTEVLATNLLLRACTVGDIELVQFFQTVGTDPNVRKLDESALGNAIRSGNAQLVRLLIDGGAALTLVRWRGRRMSPERTPLGEAIRTAKSDDIVRLLLERGADVNEKCGPYEAWTPLDFAVKLGCTSVVQMLLSAGASIDRWSPKYGTALQLAAKCDNIEIVHVLLANGCHVDFPLDSSIEPGWDSQVFPYHVDAHTSPLVHATRNGNVLMVNALLEAWANPEPGLSKRRQLFFRELATVTWDSKKAFFHVTDTALQTAVRIKSFELMKILLDAGASVNSPQCGDSPLQIAVEVDEIDLVISLIAHGAVINAPTDWPFGRTAVQAASANGNIDLLKFLLSSLPDDWRLQVIDAPPSRVGGRTAVQAAAENGHVEALTLLLGLGANVDALPAERLGVTTLQAAALSGSLAIAYLVFIAGADTSTPLGTVSALSVAMRQKNLHMFELLLQYGVDVNSAPIKDGHSPLQVAAMQESTVYLRELLCADADVNAWWKDGLEATALHTAVKYTRLEATQLLLQAGAFLSSAAWPDLDIHHKGVEILPIDSELITPMRQFGSENMHIDDYHRRFSLLEERDGFIIREEKMHDYSLPLETQYSRYIDGYNALAIAIHRWLGCEESCPDLIKLLIDHGANVDSRIISDSADRARSVLGFAAENGLQDAVRTLLASGADVNWRFSLEDETALVSAISGGDDAIVHMILDAGADVNTTSPGVVHCDTPLQRAVMVERTDYVRLLLARDADVNAPSIQHNRDSGRPGATILQDAVRSGNEEIIHLILEAGADINAPASIADRSRNALQQAADMGNLNLIQVLLQKGADVNAPASRDAGVTALQAASLHGHLAIVVKLLDAGADINGLASEYDGRTALEGAAEHGRLDIVALLLENDDEMEDFYDRCEDAAEYAEEEGHSVIAKMLREYRK